LYEAALPFLTRSSDRLAACANIGRASAALGKKQRFAEAWAEFDRLALAPVPQFYAESLIELAQGLATLQYWKHASRMLNHAQLVAQETRSLRAISKAERLRAIVDRRDNGDVNKTADSPSERFTTKLRERLAPLAAAVAT
jgi:hypothetical protein